MDLNKVEWKSTTQKDKPGQHQKINPPAEFK